MPHRLRALVVTCHLPYPAISGGRRRELELFSRVADQVDLHLCAVSKTPEEDGANAGHLDDIFRTIRVFEAQDGQAAGCPEARHRSPAATAYIHGACARGDFDLTHVEGFYLMQHLRLSRCPAFLVEQNVEFELWRQRAAIADPELDRRRLRRQFEVTRRAELNAWRAADSCAAVTEEDANLMEEALPGLNVAVVPDGIDHLPQLEAAREPLPGEVVFAGNFSYEPNVDAARYYLEQIHPLVPAGHVTLVGNAPPPELRELTASDPRITVTGRVDDVTPYLDRAAVVVCPLRIGGGIKVKVLEALRRGKALVTTSVGAQGLRAGAGAAFEVADDPRRFAHTVGRLLDSPPARRRLERAAAAFTAKLPTWDDAAAALLGGYESCLLAAGVTAARAK